MIFKLMYNKIHSLHCTVLSFDKCRESCIHYHRQDTNSSITPPNSLDCVFVVKPFYSQPLTMVGLFFISRVLLFLKCNYMIYIF